MKDPIDHSTAEIPGLDQPPRWQRLPSRDQAAQAVVTDMGWAAVLHKAIEDEPRGIQGVADRLGCSRCYISQMVNGLNGFDKRPPSRRFQEKLFLAYAYVPCPHLGQMLKHDACAAYAALTWGQVQGSGFEAAKHWRACQKCPHRPGQTPTPAH